MNDGHLVSVLTATVTTSVVLSSGAVGTRLGLDQLSGLLTPGTAEWG